MVYKDENYNNIINIYNLFFNINEKIDTNTNIIWVEIQDAILVNEYTQDSMSVMIQRFNDIKIVCPIHYNSIKKIYEKFKLKTVNDYEIIKIH